MAVAKTVAEPKVIEPKVKESKFTSSGLYHVMLAVSDAREKKNRPK